MIPVRDLLDDFLGDAPGKMGNALLALPLAGKVKPLTAGVAHLCGVFVDGSTRCWGGANDSGQLGVGDTTARGPAAALPVNLGAGRTALLDDGTVKCWGLGSSGELGLGNKEQHEKLRSGPACQGRPRAARGGSRWRRRARRTWARRRRRSRSRSSARHRACGPRRFGHVGRPPRAMTLPRGRRMEISPGGRRRRWRERGLRRPSPGRSGAARHPRAMRSARAASLRRPVRSRARTEARSQARRG